MSGEISRGAAASSVGRIPIDKRFRMEGTQRRLYDHAHANDDLRREAADRAHVTREEWYLWELGERLPVLSQLITIARALEATVWELAEGD